MPETEDKVVMKNRHPVILDRRFYAFLPHNQPDSANNRGRTE